MGLTVRPARRPRAPGWTRCPVCRLIVDNLEMVEVVREGRTKGKWVCQVCGDRAAGLIRG